MKKGTIFNAKRGHPIYIIVAVDEQNGIGKNGKLPWHLKGDMKFFRDITTKTADSKKQNMVIMGRKTWQSISEKFRPLKNRKNVILTRDPHFKLHEKKSHTSPVIYHSFDEAADRGQKDENIENIFIIGGAEVFKEALKCEKLTGIYLTKIHKTFDCDTFFPKIPKNLKREKHFKQKKENEIVYDFYLIH